MTAKEVVSVALPYLAAAVIIACAVTGKVSPEYAVALAIALGINSPVAHAAKALGEAMTPKPPAPPKE